MGMDVCGKKGDTYFRASVWSWRPLWDYCSSVAPDLCARVEHAYTNDGDGLNGDDATLLGMELTQALADGSAQAYVAAHQSALDAIPKERCQWCDGTGTRTDAIGVSMGMVERKWCNGCNGAGEHPAHASMYELRLETIAEFRDFLAECGGFEVW